MASLVNYPANLAALVHRSSQSASVGHWVRFNHDLIAEVGIGQAYATEQAGATEAGAGSFNPQETVDTDALLALLAYLLEKQDPSGALQLYCYLHHENVFEQEAAHQYRLTIIDLHVERKVYASASALLNTCRTAAEKRRFAGAVLAEQARLLALGSSAPPLMRLMETDTIGIQAARKVLAQHEFWKLPHQIISTALNILGKNDEFAKGAARKVLAQHEFWKLQSEVTSTALKILGERDKDAKGAARTVLAQHEFWKLPYEVTSAALNILGNNDKEAKRAARKVLAQHEFWKLPDSIVTTALNILGKKDEFAKGAARKVLAQYEFWKLPHQIISTALNILGAGNQAAESAALTVIRQAKVVETFLIFSAVKVLAETSNSEAMAVLQTYLDDLYNKTTTTAGEFRLRHDLLFLPLFFSEPFLKFWSKKAKGYRSNGSILDKQNIYKILHCLVLFGEQGVGIKHVVTHLCQNISKYCVDDVLHQWSTNPRDLSLMHIGLAFAILKRSDWQLSALTRLQLLARQHPDLVRAAQFKELILVLQGERDVLDSTRAE